MYRNKKKETKQIQKQKKKETNTETKTESLTETKQIKKQNQMSRRFTYCCHLFNDISFYLSQSDCINQLPI